MLSNVKGSCCFLASSKKANSKWMKKLNKEASFLYKINNTC